MIAPSLEAEARRAAANAENLHRLKLELAKLVLSQASPSAVNQLHLVERFLEGQASAAELADARQDAWAYVGSLACYCSPTDSASAQAVLSCLETGPAAHTGDSLLEQVERVLLCGISERALLEVLIGCRAEARAR